MVIFLIIITMFNEIQSRYYFYNGKEQNAWETGRKIWIKSIIIILKSDTGSNLFFIIIALFIANLAGNYSAAVMNKALRNKNNW